MPSLLRFRKMHGAGNDFIVIRDDAETFPDRDAPAIARLCAPHTGIACDGLILVRPPHDPDAADFRMDFVNPDGSPAGMCGNGARCAARFAFEEGIAPASMRIETAAGLHLADILPDTQVRITFPSTVNPVPKTLALPVPHALGLLDSLDHLDSLEIRSLNTGVPHAVVPVPLELLPRLDLPRLGSWIRHHPAFAPAGTNVDFIAPPAAPTSPIPIRTYERGVEAETLACGTGITASALVAIHLGWTTSPATLRTPSGDLLRVTLSPLTLTGPTATLYTATLAPGFFP
ncbi:MAG: diaminopimelate epimerase [Kiritimatiellae bacterium]|nr:diaminopimelate epimerase [Kiritimatiellia bacterium]